MRFFQKHFLALLSITFLLTSVQFLHAQIVNPVSWSFNQKELGDNKIELQFKATIDPHWHIYAMNIEGDGPIPTTFNFMELEGAELLGETQEPKGVTVHDPMFDIDLTYFEDEAIFTQVVKLNESTGKVSGELEFMVCDDSRCLPPDYIEFDFALKATKPTQQKSQPKESKPKVEENEKTVPTQTQKQTASEEKPTQSSSISVGAQPTSTGNNDESGILEPIEWSFKVEETGENEYQLVAAATLDDHWHLYTTDLPSDDGPIATSFAFEKNDAVELIGELESRGKRKDEYDPNFMMDLSFFEHEASFVQKFKLTGEGALFKGSVEFMVCDDKRCLPPEIKSFEFEVGDATSIQSADAEEEPKALKTDGDKSNKSKSLWTILFISIGGGLAALFTPCVFPMIPMTVSFFTKQSKTRAEGIRKGVIYGLSIIVIYVLFSAPFHVFDSISPDVFNEFSTNPYLNIAFFLIFIIFAISFLGAFEIMIPNSWVNKADRASDKGGLIGIFFMALTLILVSFSCTGPAIGLLLGSVLSSDGGATALSVGMLGFGLGLGLPFGLFAAFPGWMNNLPKSGGWLNVVKVSFGFLELAFAFKFLSNADLVTQSGLLYRELFIAIWIGVFLAWALYMFGAFRLPHDSPVEKISVGRGIIATFLLVFVFYLIPGMWGAPLKLISGFPPPMFYSESPNGVGAESTMMVSSSNGNASNDIPEGADPAHCPHNLSCFHDYETGVAYAKKVGKPVMLDFTGWACVNCRRMEENVWSDPRVLKRLRENVVLISLYVDEREKLPEDEQYVSDATGKKIRTVGNKWSEFQIKNYQSNTQPYYVITDYDGNELIESSSYDPDIQKFVDWLDRGVKAYEKEVKN